MIKKAVKILTILTILIMFGLLVGMSGCIKKEVSTPTVVPTATPVNVVPANLTPINTEKVFSNDSEKGNLSIVSMNFYGGIVGTADKSPVGTIIDANLTKYYGIPTAIGGGKTYWFVGGWGWFNETEMMKLPSESIMYDVSPYACCNGGGGSTAIPVPISGYVILAFIGFVVIFTFRSKLRKK